MADFQQPILALLGDVLEEGDTLEEAQVRFERWEAGSERDAAQALLWLAAVRLHLHRLRGAHNTLDHLRARFRGRFPDLEAMAALLEVRLLMEEQEHGRAMDLLEQTTPEHRDPRARRRLSALGHTMRGEILTATGREAVAHYEYRRARECLKVGEPERVDRALVAGIHQAEGDTHVRLGEMDAALGAFSRAGAAAPDFLLSRARSLLSRGHVHLVLKDMEPGLASLREAFGLYRQAGSPRGVLRASVRLGRALYDTRQFGEAMVCFQQAREHCAEGRHPQEEAEVAGLIGDILLTGGRYREAAASYGLALQIAADPLTRARALQRVGRVQGLLGDHAGAEAALVESRCLFLQVNDLDGLQETLVQLVLCHAEQGRAAAAREALDSLERTGRPLGQGLSCMLAGLVLRREGQPEEAGRMLDLSLRSLSHQPDAHAVLGSLERARVARDLGEERAGVRYCRQAVQWARELHLHDVEQRALDLLSRLDHEEWAGLLQQVPSLMASEAPVPAFVAVLAVELRGLAPVPDRSDAELQGLLDRYFDLASQRVLQAGGGIVQILGTRILAVFGLEGPCDPPAVVSCAQGLLDRLGDVSVAAAVACGPTMKGPWDGRVLGGAPEVAMALLDRAAPGELRRAP